MREIKFRAWHQDMWLVDSIDWTLEKSDLHASEEYSHILTVSGSAFRDTVFMQYTGLKDKNGVEIYEGDIMSYLRCPERHTGCICKKLPDPDFIDVVIWDAPSFTCKELSSRLNTYEVIGNIYENPELLK